MDKALLELRCGFSFYRSVLIFKSLAGIKIGMGKV